VTEEQRMTGPVLTSKAAAEYCGMAVQTLYNLISQGAGPKHYKHGTLSAFYAADLDEWNRARLQPIAAGLVAGHERTVDVTDLASILGVSTDTVYRMVRSGDLPGFKLGGVWRFFPSTVKAHLERPKDAWQQSTRSRARKRITD
jgi:excisionase family DNA binding protein